MKRIIGNVRGFCLTEMKQLLLAGLFMLPCFVSAQTTVAGFDGLVFKRETNSYQVQLTDSFNLHQLKLTPKKINPFMEYHQFYIQPLR